MENNEIMTNEEEMLYGSDYEEEMETSSGMGTGLAMLIGSGLTLATIAGVKKLKKVWASKKLQEEKTSDCKFEVSDETVIDIEEMNENHEEEN